jgi:hypothetical protein
MVADVYGTVDAQLAGYRVAILGGGGGQLAQREQAIAAIGRVILGHDTRQPFAKRFAGHCVQPQAAIS